MKLVLARAATAAAMIAVAATAHATGEGTYTVDGQGPNAANPYHGTAELKQTGQGTWHMHWQIGTESWDGTGVGDSQAFAVSYSSGNQTGTALYVSDGKSGYRAIWAGSGDTQVGIETLTPAPAGAPKP
ncbi:MAG TPA: hypothetical protein VJY39_18715 [Acidisphaera sp.]|nr:hypothetical protein [Acidisphaera sp.]